MTVNVFCSTQHDRLAVLMSASRRGAAIVLYLHRLPVSLRAIAKKMPGEIANDTLVTTNAEIDQLGIVRCFGRSPKDCKQVTLETMRKIKEEIGEIKVMALGEEDRQSGKVSVFVPDSKYITDVISREVQLAIRRLGFQSEKTEEISHVVANELLCRIAVHHHLSTGAPVMAGLLAKFAGWFVINEKLKKDMVEKYSKTVEEHAAAIEGHSSALKRLAEALHSNRRDITIALISGLVVEACIRVIILLVESWHKEMGSLPWGEFGELPAPSVMMIESRKSFSALEFSAVANMEEFRAVVILNSLDQLGIVQVVNRGERIYVGTGQKIIPKVVAVTTVPQGEKAVMSDFFSSTVSTELKKDGFDYTPTRPNEEMMHLYRAIFPEISS